MAMEIGGGDHVSIRPSPEGGRFIELNGVAVFQIRPGDVDFLTGESVDEVAKKAAQSLRTAVSESREQGKAKVLLKGLGFTVLASALFYLICRFIYWGERGIISRLQTWLAIFKAKLTVAIHPQQAINAFIFLIRLSKWALIMMAGYEWVTFSLSQFPY
ncbi:MAG: hypothetical protein ACU88J_10735, partial [Gammaproteobacteria bacterium]